MKYPVYSPHFVGKEKEYVNDCLDSTWISSKGRYIALFEDAFSQFVGVKHAASVSNGTVALHVALIALGIGPGDEVLVPTFTYIASVNSIAYTGATPVFVDSEPEFWQIDVADARRKISAKTKAIMPVHLYGQACDMVAIMELAREHNLLVVEDCAEAIGSMVEGAHVGTFGDISTFSFFGNKTITTGEGGMVVTNNDEYAEMVNRLKGQGLAANREYWHDLVGFNYRMTNICAAIGYAQLEGIGQILAKKKEIAVWYKEELVNLALNVHAEREGSVHSYWMVSILLRDKNLRDPMRRFLRENGVETRPLFHLSHEMEMYKEDISYPVAEDLSTRGMNLPSYPDLGRQDVANICALIRKFMLVEANK
ncbi:DegT/DnrJ/EryC1/StrS aminotransferase family protein (plasmid) [Shinella sp. B3.7]|uniref:DegT/DnrJ/EryC1/StrS aminotransferase family protein n=1 Tax=Shinella sedimenti TaxID=2919913 RepID=A0ABT0CS24_9HYPH|nr:DegT/DnrJ/EryC1/StrS aminotransferase family protein [Shinella sedimenti]